MSENPNPVPDMQDPKEMGLKPPFPEQAQPFPSLERRLKPPADHGEETYKGSGKLTGKVALITGADSGIGRAVAIAYAREGADVVISYFNEREDAFKTQSLVEAAGQRALALPADIREESDCQSLVQRTVEEFGHLDILVNNAAYSMNYPHITKIIAEDFDRIFRTNVYGTFFLCKAAAGVMQPGSVIINTSSVQAYQPSPEQLPYAASKAAIITLSKGMAKQLIEEGIRVNVVAPGPVWTPLIPQTMPAEQVATFGADTPMGRPAQPMELAPVYVLLASNEASYITGAVYEVTGGMLIG